MKRMKGVTFTIEAGFQVQNEQLARWKKILKPAVYLKLWGEAKTRNSQLKPAADGYDVWRGTSMDQFLSDIMYVDKGNNLITVPA